jgi:hypothetical protein
MYEQVTKSKLKRAERVFSDTKKYFSNELSTEYCGYKNDLKRSNGKK